MTFERRYHKDLNNLTTDDDHTQYYGSGLREPDHGALGGLADDDHNRYVQGSTTGQKIQAQRLTKDDEDTITFPSAFSSATGLVVVATVEYDDAFVAIDSVTKDNFVVYFMDPDGVHIDGVTFHYIAIGPK